MEKNILLTIEYDGSVFHGWQRDASERCRTSRTKDVFLQVELKVRHG